MLVKVSLGRPLFPRSGDQPGPRPPRPPPAGAIWAPPGVRVPPPSPPRPALPFVHHRSVPRFLPLPLPANHFSAGNDAARSGFQTFLEHGEIGKQNKTGNESLLTRFADAAPAPPPRGPRSWCRGPSTPGGRRPRPTRPLSLFPRRRFLSPRGAAPLGPGGCRGARSLRSALPGFAPSARCLEEAFSHLSRRFGLTAFKPSAFCCHLPSFLEITMIPDEDAFLFSRVWAASDVSTGSCSLTGAVCHLQASWVSLSKAKVSVMNTPSKLVLLHGCALRFIHASAPFAPRAEAGRPSLRRRARPPHRRRPRPVPTARGKRGL